MKKLIKSLKLHQKNAKTTFVFTFGAVIFAAGLVMSCFQPASSTQKRGGTGGTDDEIPLPTTPQTTPRLMSLAIESEGSQYELGDKNGATVAFNSETFSYTVKLEPGEIPSQIKLVAVPVSPYIVNYNGKEIFVPDNGDVAVISVIAQSTGLSQNYVITFTAGNLEPAKLSSIQLSTGAITGFSQNTFTYNVPLQYAQNGSVAVYASGLYPNSTFTFTPSANITLENGGSSLSGTMVVTVSAPGFSPTDYTLNFTMPEPAASTLNGISLSRGALTDSTGSVMAPFAVQPMAGSTQYITLPNGITDFILTVDKKQGSVVTSSGVVLNDSGSASFTGPFSASNNTFSITVNEGTGYLDTTYNFQIIQSTIPAATLTNLIVSGGSVSFFQRNQNGTNSHLPFFPDYLMYNVSFESSGDTTTITAVPEADATVTINGVQNNTLSSVTHLSGPVQITVAKTGALTTVYTVYTKLASTETATLTNIVIAGGILADRGGEPTIFNDREYGYAIKVFLNTNNPTLIVTGVVDDPEFSVSYPNGNFISPITGSANGASITVRVEGGANYEPCLYFFSIMTVEPQNPRLSSISINDAALNGFWPDTLYYTKTFLSSAAATQVRFSWNVQNSVSAVYYSIDYGAHWNGPAANPTSNIVSLTNGDSKLLYVKACAEDGAETIYVINLTKSPSFLTNLSVNGAPQELAASMQPSYEYINMPTGDFTISAQAANSSGAVFTWEGATSSNGGLATVSALTAGLLKTVTLKVQVSDKFSTYTLHLYKPLAYYYQEGASAGGNGETPNSPYNDLGDALRSALYSGINKLEIIGQITPASAYGGNADSLFWFYEGYGTADTPFIIRNFNFNPGGGVGKRIVFIDSTSTDNYIVFENPRINGTITALDGAGMYITSSAGHKAEVTLKATTVLGIPLVYNNITLGNGGGIAITGVNSKLVLQDETGTSQRLIYGNSATRDASMGGGLYIDSYAAVEIYAAKIEDNNSSNLGGGIYLGAGASCLLNGAYVTKNRAETGRGGGFYISTGGICRLNGTYVTENLSHSGGGFYMAGGTLTIGASSNALACQISENSAASTGGGIYLYRNATVNFIVNTTISGNTAISNTAGLHIEGASGQENSVTFNAPVLFQNNLHPSRTTHSQITKSPYNSITNISNIFYPHSGYNADGIVSIDVSSSINTFNLTYSTN
ncbi:MAG: hypothetical protein LBD20_08475 [Spirochaetaceae bacterium]|jgi:hypothetical protein|nr:hypothetical protein [Spirochaetaceae bacterium]